MNSSYLGEGSNERDELLESDSIAHFGLSSIHCRLHWDLFFWRLTFFGFCHVVVEDGRFFLSS